MSVKPTPMLVVEELRRTTREHHDMAIRLVCNRCGASRLVFSAQARPDSETLLSCGHGDYVAERV